MSASATQSRRVVVTGIGTISPLGLSTRDTWAALTAGRSGVRRITHFDPTPFACQIAAEIDIPEGFFARFTPAKDLKRFARFTHLALAAVDEAMGDSGLGPLLRPGPDAGETAAVARLRARSGVNIGVGMGGLPEIEATHRDLLEKGPRRVSPFFIPQVIANMASGQASIAWGLQGPNLCNVTACASSAHALGESAQWIRSGHVDVMVAGGAEAVISGLGIGGFASMKALSTRNAEPTRASRPFDQARDGFVMGEGACVLILEELEHARARRARIYAELTGYGATGDAYHMTAPAPDHAGGYRAMQMALESARLKPQQIGYVNAHGTSTPAGDVEEARAVARLMGPHAREVAVSSTKSMTGHLLGAAGALEAAVCVLALTEGVIPPTINLDTLDPECAATGLSFTPHQAIQRSLAHALTNSFGFGGTNATLIFSRV